jgi:hypothetical protein
MTMQTGPIVYRPSSRTQTPKPETPRPSRMDRLRQGCRWAFKDPDGVFGLRYGWGFLLIGGTYWVAFGFVWLLARVCVVALSH